LPSTILFTAASERVTSLRNGVTEKRDSAKDLQTIWREFDDSVRAIVPLFETEVRRVPMLQRLSDAMFALDDKAASKQNASISRAQQAGARP
jgi:hypothetical protein